MSNVASWPFEKRLEETFNRCLPKLGPEARAQLAALISPEALAIIAGVLVAWVVSHAFGIGEIIDIIILAVGVVSIGLAVFTGLDHLYEFATGAYNARSEHDLDVAADHLAKAIGILGIQAVLAVLFRGAKPPLTGRGGRIPVGTPPPRTPGLRYRPTIQGSPRLPAGAGETSAWGDIVYSLRGTASDVALVRLHERVHQILTPRLYLLRQFRVESRMGSYVRSSLWRYLEEALAETVAQVGVNGFRNVFVGVRFPVKEGYVYLQRAGAAPSFGGLQGSGVIPEGAALLGTGTIAGMSYTLWFKPGQPAAGR